MRLFQPPTKPPKIAPGDLHEERFEGGPRRRGLGGGHFELGGGFGREVDVDAAVALEGVAGVVVGRRPSHERKNTQGNAKRRQR